MASSKLKKDTFSQSGPCFLTNYDWNDMGHKRIIMASLAKSVSILVRDCRKHRHGTEHALAPAWWESFNFDLDANGILEDGFGIFGAIFKFKPLAGDKNTSSSSWSLSGLQNAPQYVVVFRGSLFKEKTAVKDLCLGARSLFHTLHRSNRFDIAFDAVKKLVQRDSSSAGTKVCLAGHSLGSAIAMLVGKNMIFEGYPPLETYLFNPPFPSLLIESIPIGMVRDSLRVASSMLRWGTALVDQAISSREQPIIASDHDMFHRLSQSGWTPWLFVNKHDMICSGFITYFERRKLMRDFGAEEAERNSMKMSPFSLFTRKFLGKDTQTLNVLPSARMVTTSANGFFKAHSLKQWYHPDLLCDYELYLVDEMKDH